MCKIRAIAALGHQDQIGLNGGLPWDIPSDLAHFKKTTMGCIVVVGRRTLESIGKNLPGREIYLNTQMTNPERSIEKFNKDVWVIGGAMTYKNWLPYASELWITRVNYGGNADVFFPVEYTRTHKIHSIESGPDNTKYEYWIRM